MTKCAHGALEMWVGVRIDHGIAAPTIAFELEWWAESAIQFGTQRAADCAVATTQLASRLGGHDGLELLGTLRGMRDVEGTNGHIWVERFRMVVNASEATAELDYAREGE